MVAWVRTTLLLFGIVTFAAAASAAETRVLDDFETLAGWRTESSEGARVEIAHDAGHTGMGLRLDFDFDAGGGFVFIHKDLPITLPENYSFSFQLRGEAPSNNLEIKLVDPSGRNVWWLPLRDYSFPTHWTHIVAQKRHFEFAWGPAGGGVPRLIGAIELAISVGSGGKGSIWIDELRFEEREPTTAYTLRPALTASTSALEQSPERLVDADPGTGWRSGSLAAEQWLVMDFLKRREYGGLVIDWDPQDYAVDYRVLTSRDGAEWEPAYRCAEGNGRRDYVYLPDAESRFVKLVLERSSRGQGYGIRAIEVRPYAFSDSLNQFFEAIARDSPPGLYPRYFLGQQSFWTVVGVESDEHEALINEEGMIEVDRGGFSIEPFLYADDRLISWREVQSVQELDQGYLPIPSVTWRYNHLSLKVTTFAAGEAGAAFLYARYRVRNESLTAKRCSLLLAIRPFQVTPPWQSLNMAGGVAPIRQLSFDGRSVWVNRARPVIPLTLPDQFGAASFDEGSVTDYLLDDRVPLRTEVNDPFGHAGGALRYSIELPPQGAAEVYVAVPFNRAQPAEVLQAAAAGPKAYIEERLAETRAAWRRTLNRVAVTLPAEAEKLTRVLKSTLAYILINRDGAAIQPGSRNYARSWIRDGALTSSSLLEMGYTAEARAFLEWYTGYQYANGKVPCCVDRRGADPVAEHDSHGEFIFAVAEYYRYTRDVGFLSELWPNVVKAVDYLAALRETRLTPEFDTAEKRAYRGLLPESISHEGYAARPVHSYWDDFLALRGLKDAAVLARALGDEERAVRFATLRDAFRNDLYASIGAAMQNHRIDFIPGSVELGDFDPSSTAIAVAPVGELERLPQTALERTFERYYRYFTERREERIEWSHYSPYELRIVEPLVRLGHKDRALEVLNYMLAAQRPPTWNQWPEIIERDPSAPRFLGDLPHTWVGSIYIRALRSLFAYEREADGALVVAAGLPEAWARKGVGIKRLPTHYGSLSLDLRDEGPDRLRLRLYGDVALPPGKLVLRSPLARPLTAVTVNGIAVPGYADPEIAIPEFPADVVLDYGPLPVSAPPILIDSTPVAR